MDVLNHEDVFSFAEDYKKFISTAKTEREAVKYFEQLSKDKSFSDICSGSSGFALYAINDNKNILLLRKGKLGLEHGINFVFAHIDSPRIDLKQNPLYESSDMALFKTHYYGGIKNING